MGGQYVKFQCPHDCIIGGGSKNEKKKKNRTTYKDGRKQDKYTRGKFRRC